MGDEFKFEVQMEEGERHPSHPVEIDWSRVIAHQLSSLTDAFMRIEHQLHQQNRVLHEFLERTTPHTYHPTIGGSISVRE